MELQINSNGKLALFILKGKVGWDNSRILDAQIHKMIDQGCTYIVFNLDEVTFLCSGGIGALVYNLKKVQDGGGDIFIVSGSDYIQFLFATIGFNIIFRDRVFETFEDFSENIMVPRGLTLNPVGVYTNVIQDEAPSGQKSRSAAA